VLVRDHILLLNSCAADDIPIIFQHWKTHVPLNAPTGLRTGTGVTSIIRCEVWNPRRAVIWAKLVAGRANAALRSAEGIRAAMIVGVGVVWRVLFRRCLFGCVWSVVCWSGQVPMMEMELGA
jgi:hypothetical protein